MLFYGQRADGSRFLDAWRAGDYPSSFDNLHCYFDYTMHSRDRSAYQYALLNLAILQADFGCHGEAVFAMQEAVSIARESHDVNCLNFCMSWLYHFGKAFPEQMKDVQSTGMLGNEKEGLAFLKAKSKETEMWSLLSTTLLSEAKLELQNVSISGLEREKQNPHCYQGESLASAIENIVRASHLNVTKNHVSSMGPQLLLQTSLFSRIGSVFFSQSQLSFCANRSQGSLICRGLIARYSGNATQATPRLKTISGVLFGTVSWCVVSFSLLAMSLSDITAVGPTRSV